jgi:hypothetical protein
VFTVGWLVGGVVLSSPGVACFLFLAIMNVSTLSSRVASGFRVCVCEKRAWTDLRIEVKLAP